jgi:hypothetical protein
MVQHIGYLSSRCAYSMTCKYDFLLSDGAEGVSHQNKWLPQLQFVILCWSTHLAMMRSETKEHTNMTTQRLLWWQTPKKDSSPGCCFGSPIAQQVHWAKYPKRGTSFWRDQIASYVSIKNLQSKRGARRITMQRMSEKECPQYLKVNTLWSNTTPQASTSSP